MREFKVNEYITLKLEDDRTKIYVKRRCVHSLDSRYTFSNAKTKENVLKEFEESCLRIKRWVDQGYDVTLLPNSVAFPLLNDLMKLGVPISNKMFKDILLKGFLEGVDVPYLLANNYLNYFDKEELDQLFNINNINKFSGGKISPYYMKKVKDVAENFFKLLLKNDIRHYIESENRQIFETILCEDLLDEFSEKELQEFDLKKLEELIFKLLIDHLNYYIENYYYLEDVFQNLQKISKFFFFRATESPLNFFQRFFVKMGAEQKSAFISYLLFDQNHINQVIFEKIHLDLKDLDWDKICKTILENFSHAYGSYKKNVKLNEIMIKQLEQQSIPFLYNISREIKNYLHKITLNYRGLYDDLPFNAFGVILENNPTILRNFLSKYYNDLNSEEKCLLMTTFIVNQGSPEILISSLKDIYNQLDLLELSEVVSKVIFYSSDQNIEETSIEELGELGVKLLLNLLMKGEFDFEYRDSIGRMTTSIIEDQKDSFKSILIDYLITCFKENRYQEIANLLDTEVVKLLNKEELLKIINSSKENFFKIINKMYHEKCIPYRLEYFLSKMGSEGGDLIFKFTQKHDYLDYMDGIMREMGEDLIDPFIKNVVINEYDYKYSDWGYHFVEEFFKIFNKKKLNRIFEEKEFSLIDRLIQSYFPSSYSQEIIMFLIKAYEHLDEKIIEQIHRKLPKNIKKEIELHFRQAQEWANASTIRKFNEILKLIGRQDEILMDTLFFLKDVLGIPIFEDLEDILKNHEFSFPKKLVETLSELKILLEENIDLFCPENYGSEEKYYINDLFYEFEKFLQYIIFGYYSTDLNQMIIQMAHFFEGIVILNKIIYSKVERDFEYEDIDKLRNKNYKYYKGQGTFLEEPIWMEKHKILCKKLHLKPRSYPAIRVRWWNDEKWNNYIKNRNNNLQQEFAYYFAKRRYAYQIIQKMSFEIIDDQLVLKTSNKLVNDEINQLIKFNEKSCKFKLNMDNIITGLSLPRNYYRECALEFLHKIKSENISKSVSEFVNELSHQKIEQLKRNLVYALAHKDRKEREWAAKQFGLIELKYQNMTYNQILQDLNEEYKAILISRLGDHFEIRSNLEKLEYEQVKSLIEALIAINTEASALKLRNQVYYIKYQDLNEKVNHFLRNIQKSIINKVEEESYCKYPEHLKFKEAEITEAYNLQRNFGHSKKITCLQISPDGKNIITASYDNTIRIWDLKTGKQLKIFKDEVYRNNLIVSINGERIIYCSKHTGYQEIKELDLKSEKFIKVMKFQNIFTVPYKIGNNKMILFTLNPDIGFEIRDYETGNLFQVIKGKFRKSISFLITSDEKFLIYCDFTLDINFIDLNSGNYIYKIKNETLFGGKNRILASTSDGKHLITTYHNNHIKIWDIHLKALIKNIVAHSGVISSIIISPDNKYIITASDDKTIKMWDLKKLMLVKEIKEINGNHSIVAITPNGDNLIIAASNYFEVYNINSGKKLYSTSIGRIYYDNSPIVMITPDGKRILNIIYGSINIWEMGTGKQLMSFKFGGINKIAISQNSKYIVCGLNDWSIKVVDLSTGNLISTCSGHKHGIRDVTISRDNSIIASSSIDGTVRLWDFKTGNLLYTFFSVSLKLIAEEEWEQHQDEINRVLISPNMRYIAAGSVNKHIVLWNYYTKKELYRFDLFDKIMFTMFFTPDDKYLLINSRNLIEIWDLETGIKFRTLELMELKDVFSIKDKRIFLCGTNGFNILLFDLKNNHTIGLIKLNQKIKTIQYIPDSTSFMAHCDGDDVFILNFSDFLNN